MPGDATTPRTLSPGAAPQPAPLTRFRQGGGRLGPLSVIANLVTASRPPGFAGREEVAAGSKAKAAALLGEGMDSRLRGNDGKGSGYAVKGGVYDGLTGGRDMKGEWGLGGGHYGCAKVSMGGMIPKPTAISKKSQPALSVIPAQAGIQEGHAAELTP